MRPHREWLWLLGVVVVVALLSLTTRRTPEAHAAGKTTLHFTAEKKARRYEFTAQDATASWTASWMRGESEPLTLRGDLRPNELQDLLSALQEAHWRLLPSRGAEIGEETYTLTVDNGTASHTLTFSGRPDFRYGAVLDRLTRSRVYDASEGEMLRTPAPSHVRERTAGFY